MKKGFTLVELVTTLVILSIIALIVTPNILVSVKDYKNQVYDTNIGTIKSATMSWAADNINDTHFPTDENTSLLVTIDELIENGSLNEGIVDSVNGGTFDDEDHDTFAIIDCINVVDEITGEIKNSKYIYNVYISMDDFLEKKALEYAKENNITGTVTITTSDLINGKYIKEHIYKTDKNNSSKKDISDNTEITITYNNGKYNVVVK